MNRRTIKIWQDPCYLGYNVAIIEERGDKLFVMRPLGEMVRHEITPGDGVEPTFRLTHEQGADLVNEFQKLNVKTETDAKRDGKLEATERHLADLRQMLKLK